MPKYPSPWWWSFCIRCDLEHRPAHQEAFRIIVADCQPKQRINSAGLDKGSLSDSPATPFAGGLVSKGLRPEEIKEVIPFPFFRFPPRFGIPN